MAGWRRAASGICVILGAAGSAACATNGTPSPARAPCAPCAPAGPYACSGVDAHGSVRGFLATHLSPTAWRDFALRDSVREGSLRLPAALAAGSLAALAVDARLGHAARGTFGGNEDIGTYAQDGLVAASLLIGALRPGEGRSSRDETWTQAEALAITFGLTQGLKPIIQRQRPDQTDHLSFPSGHTSAAFCAATLIERNSGPALGIPAYGVAALVGFSRVEARRHFASDVLAGAALGTAVATLVDALHFGDGSPGEGISSCCPVSVEAGSTEDGRPELRLSLGL